MRIEITHARDLNATADEVGRLIAGLGSDDDRLWPSETWPGTVIEFDRPLAAGAVGGHGMIRYRVEEYDPARQVTFRFCPGQGLDGVHGFSVEPLGNGTTRLVHRLDVRLGGSTRLTRPVLQRMHDVLILQLLDRAELATAGTVAQPVRMPAWIRATNGVEARLVAARVRRERRAQDTRGRRKRHTTASS